MATINGTAVKKVVVACDAGMGSSVMLASQLKRQLAKNNVTVEHTPVNTIPADADVETEQHGNITSVIAGMIGLAAEDLRGAELHRDDARYPLVSLGRVRRP